MKILYLGQINAGQTARMRMRAFERLGHSVHGVHTTEPWTRAGWLKRQVQRRTMRGSIVADLNSSVLSAARQFRPSLVWADKQSALRPETIEALRKLGARVVHFTPDPYFTLRWKRTRLMDAAMKTFDVLLYCKAYEREQYEQIGKPAIYMPQGYCDEVHRPIRSNDPRWNCSVGFVGGWEPRRERLLHAAAELCSDLKIWGAHWEFLCDGRWTPRRHIILSQLAGRDTFRIHRDEILARARQGAEIYDDDYARALTGSRIGLGFLRTVCPDQHTTRTFEIPACGSLLLADRTEEHQELFQEGREAEFFSSREEMLDKLSFYCRDESARMRVARAGYDRCTEAGYSYVHRLRKALDTLSRI